MLNLMPRISLFISLILFIGLANGFNLFNKVELNKTNGAMCMDGSNFAIFTYIPDEEKPANKLMIFFEQIWEGWCTKQDLNKSFSRCHQYVNNTEFIDFGSSKNYPNDMMFLTGILATDSIFKDYYKVFIKSCDGGAYFGDASVKFKNSTLNFKGSKNFVEVMNYMKKINFIQDREQVLLVGMENGALGALAWADYVKANTKGKVKVLADSGIWENDINDKTKDNYWEKRMTTMGKLFINGGDFPNSKCQAANSNNIEECFYAYELVKHIEPAIEIIFLQSYYDGWALTEILGLECTEEFASLSECTEEHRTAIQNYHSKISDKLHDMVKLPNVAAFGISCVAHFFTKVRWDDETFSVPEGKNNTAVNIVSKWLVNKNQKAYLDQQPWPHNHACSRKVVLQPNLVSQ